jgi:DNA repair protein RecO (recombination protein O)
VVLPPLPNVDSALMAGRTYKTEAVVLRSLRFGEADRVLHLHTRARGHVGAIAKGVRRTRSRFGGRLEPLSHVELMLHEGSGELQTVTGADLIRSHAATREDPYRLGVGLVGVETVLRLFHEQEPNPRSFEAVTRFLDLLDELPSASPAQPQLAPLGLSFQLKLLRLAGYMPHLSSCAECGSEGPLTGYSPSAGGVVCRACAEAGGALSLSPAAIVAMETMVRRPLADADDAGLTERIGREVVAVLSASYEHHGGFRLRTLSA